MRRSIKALAVSSAIVAAVAVAPTLFAHATGQAGGSMMGPGMMGQMSEMMESCQGMIRSMDQDRSKKPNEQWRKSAPETDKKPETNG